MTTTGVPEKRQKLLESILAKLSGVKQSGDGWVACCPAHEDSKPSLGIQQKADRLAINCYAGCEWKDVVAALGLNPGDLYDNPKSGKARKRTISSTYDYRAADGTLLFQCVRFEPKDFRLRRPDGDGGWIYKLGNTQRVPFRLPELIAAPADAFVFFPEGEKDALNVAGRGLVATAVANGAKGWRDHLAEHFAGRRVVILPDNDKAGHAFAAAVARSLRGVAEHLKVLELPGLPAKADVSDWFAAGGTAAELLELAQAAPEWTPSLDDAPVKASGQSDRPVIYISPEVAEVIAAAESALHSFTETDVYERGGLLVRVQRDGGRRLRGLTRPPSAPAIIAIPDPHLFVLMASAAIWVKVDKKTQEAEHTLPPSWAVKGLAALGEWGFPLLEGVVEAPTLRADGSVLQTPGYDCDSGLLFISETEFPVVPENPTAAEIAAAIETLQEPYREFPFVSPCDLAAIISAQLTMIARPAIDGPCPMFSVTSPTPGTGKGLLIGAAVTVATGRPPAISAPEHDAEEMRKLITTLALEAPAAVLFDNVIGVFGSAVLAAALTATEWSGRVLGVSRTYRGPLRFVMFVTGNNFGFGPDLYRRVVPINLDAQAERPEERRFDRPDLLAWVRANRPRLLVAGLTVLRGYIAAGKPPHGLPPIGSFDGWDALVRGAVVWALGVDPCAGRAQIREEADPELEQARTLFAAWHAAFPDEPTLTAAEVIAAASNEPALSAALAALNRKGEGPPTAQALGAKLRTWKNRILSGLQLQRATGHTKEGVRWRVARVGPGDDPSAPTGGGSGSGDDGEGGEDSPADVAGALASGPASAARLPEPSSATSPSSPAVPGPSVSAPGSEWGLSAYTLVTDSATLPEVAAQVRAAGEVGIDVETTGLDAHRARLRLVQLALPDDSVFIIDTWMTDGLGPVAESLSQATLVGHNLAFDLAFLTVQGGLGSVRAWDTCLASQLLDGGEHRGQKGWNSLASVVSRSMGVSLPKEEQRSDWSGNLTRAQLDYAAADARVLLPLKEVLQRQLADSGLVATHQLECDALPAVVAMACAGVGFDAAGWSQVVALKQADVDAATAELRASGVENPRSVPQVLKAAGRLGLPIQATNAEALAPHAAHPFVAALQRLRPAQQFVSAVAPRLADLVSAAPDGRVRAGWLQIGAPTGRFSCSKPNLLALPKAPEVRRCIVPAPGHVFVVADYAAIELRVLAHLTADESMRRVFLEGGDPHRATAALLAGKPEAEVTRSERQRAKAVNFGFIFGMGAQRFVSYALKNYGVQLTLAEARLFQDRFFNAFPSVRAWQRSIGSSKPLEVRTASGRLRRFPADPYPFAEALNTPVQGTAADGIKRAMALLHERLAGSGARIVLCVHDELVVETPAEVASEVLPLVVDCMTAGMAEFVTTVPIVVDAEIRANWADRIESSGAGV